MAAETAVITEELIESGKSERGGWTKAQLAILGVSWPPESGWKRKVIGAIIPQSEALRFVELRNTATKPI